ncbi:MAG: hypothetical protein PHW95_05420 [Patescibacteria group bacterium]|nr:hypothetical protein [Patescibacteria group bacterium]
MSKRTLLIFSLFIVVAIVGSVFVYFYRDRTQVLLAAYADKIAACGSMLNEAECVSNKFCQAIYKPANDDSKKLEFVSCQKISNQELAEINQATTVCQNTGGEWYESKLGKFCLCDKAGADKIFDQTKGCLSRNQ